MAKKRVLCVDDNGFVLAAIRHLLETNGYAVVTVPNGNKALGCGITGFDVVILDYMLPDMNGLAVAKELRKGCEQLPILMYSGCTEIPNDEMNVIAAFVSKGDSIQKLLDTVGELTTKAA
jgi:CheY-like chemotaxis protein